MGMSVQQIQQALLKAGYDLGKGGADGIFGPATRKAVRVFQRSLGLPGSGIPGEKTFAALKKFSNIPLDNVTPVWYAEAQRKMGLHEKLNNKELTAYLRSDGHLLGDPSKLPWCGDFVETVIARTLPDETLPDNPYWARSWARFGVGLPQATIGAILVFSRDGGGHVGFCAGGDSTYFSVLGGNQSNRVSIMKIARSRLVTGGIRWPETAELPTKFVLAQAQGAISRNEA